MTSISVPRPVGPGSRVGVFALSGPPDVERLGAGVGYLRDAGFEVLLAPNLKRRTRYLAGDDAERLAGLAWLLEQGVDVLWAARGGYGVTRLLPELPWERLREWGGWVVGYSDVTALELVLLQRCGLASLHGPMVATLARHRPSAERALGLLSSPRPGRLFRPSPAQVLRGGRARGRAVGGNLTVMAALAGTPFEPDYQGAVVFVEEVNEPLYRLDRLLTQLRLSSRLAGAKAILAGRLVQCGVGEVGWRGRWRELLTEVAPTGAVLVEGLPFGHGAVNLAFPLGVEVEVDTDRGVVAWGGV